MTKNILFFTDADCYALRGGIDRVVGVLGGMLKQQGFNCSLAYFDKTPNEQTEPFNRRIQIDKNNFSAQLSDFIIENSIDRIVVSTANKHHSRFLLPNIKQIANNIQLYYWFHGTPVFELIPLDFKVAVYRLLHNKNKIVNLKKLLFSVFSLLFLHKIGIRLLQKKYAFVYNYADKIILLSKFYIDSYAACVGKAEKEKFISIGNSLSFDTFADEKILNRKEKIVLMVARLEDQQKRILSALNIWKKIEQQKTLSDWKLVITGSGEDENFYKYFAKKLKLRNYSFEGQQNPLDYYRRASIFMMTSSHEGFPMTLGEAQQMGVVPVIFDSFGAVYDIIDNEKNGFIIPEKNIEQYAEKLVFLMKNNELRQKMALNAVGSCKQFSAENIVKKWVELFEN